MIDHNHFICHFIFGGHLLNIPILYFHFLKGGFTTCAFSFRPRLSK